MTRYANVDKLVKAGYNMLSNDLELHDPIDWILAELDGFVIEVPTPHGDLIDRNVAISHPFANGRYSHNANMHFIYGHESYKEWLEGLPTIIEAEGEDE